MRRTSEWTDILETTGYGEPEDGVVLALDLGGTWIKGCEGRMEGSRPSPVCGKLRRWRNPLDSIDSAEAFADVILSFCAELAAGRNIRAVVAPTAGEVDARGRQYLMTGAHLRGMGTMPWREIVERKLGCPFLLINDAEAFMLGMAGSGKLPSNCSMGAMVVGTGIGFAMVRNGRWWKPARRLLHLGAIRTKDSTYDQWGSAVGAGNAAGGDLAAFLTRDVHAEHRRIYIEGLARIVASASVLFHLDEVVVGGGLADAALEAGLDLAGALAAPLPDFLPPRWVLPTVTVIAGGNSITLQGALAFAFGEAAAETAKCRIGFHSLRTEAPATSERLELLSAAEIAGRLAEAENEASAGLHKEVPVLGVVADHMAEAVRKGGRVIYVGAGTSGRLGALDAVEIPCTFGLGPARFVALIAGGMADAAMTIEDNGEEDCSAVPDPLLLQPGADDVVLGISASGSAYFVRSALACAKRNGALTVMIHEGDLGGGDFFDISLRLHSGPEMVAGSTRMKAGTATKKVLNILSTTAMIRLGKINRGFMTDLQCGNAKLHARAERILVTLAGISPEEARAGLRRNGHVLRAALAELGLGEDSR